MIRQGADAAIIRARVAARRRELLVEVQLNRSGRANRAQVNRGADASRASCRATSRACCSRRKTSRSCGASRRVRRRFLDELLVQRTPRLAGVIADYDRVLKQRNALLKSARASGLRRRPARHARHLGRAARRLGHRALDARTELVGRAQPYVARAVPVASPATITPPARPRSSHPRRRSDDGRGSRADGAVTARAGSDRRRFRRRSPRAPQELERGLTLVGPHRDDLLFELNGLPAQGLREPRRIVVVRARAQARLGRAAARRLGRPATRCSSSTTSSPSSTRRRRGMLAAAVDDYEQVLITAAVVRRRAPRLDRAHRAHRGGRDRGGGAGMTDAPGGPMDEGQRG